MRCLGSAWCAVRCRPVLLLLVLLLAASPGCGLPSEYQVSRTGWETLHAQPERLASVEGSHLRRIGGQALWIRPATDPEGRARYAVVDASSRSASGEGLYALRPVPDVVQERHLALDDPAAIDEVACAEVRRFGAVMARVPKTGEVVHLFPESLPREVPPGTEPWVTTEAVGRSGTIGVGGGLLASSLPIAYIGIVSLLANDCGSNVCGNHAIGTALLVGAGNMLAGAISFLALGFVEHPERVKESAWKDRLPLGPPTEAPARPPASTMEKTPLGLLPPAHSAGFTFEF